MRTVRIGLTGPIGCGKSTVAGMLAEHGAVVIDADRLVREVYEDAAVREAVAERFGPGVRSPDGSIDRAALARIVFDDAGALRALEAIVHPAVRPRILAGIDAAEAGRAAAVVVEAIKLVESGLAGLCDEVWLVTCDPPVQRGRSAGSRRPRGRRQPAYCRPAPPPRPRRAGCHAPDRHLRVARGHARPGRRRMA